MTRSNVLVVFLSVTAFAQDAGVDAPVATRRLDGSVVFNKPAYTLLDNELRRLQQVERDHQNELKERQWWIPVLVGVGVGVLLATPVVLTVEHALDATKAGSK